MFERFTDESRRVVVLAQEEARLFNHNYIGTEHILLGLVQERNGVAAQALGAFEISLDHVRAAVEGIIGHGADAPSGHIPFTPRAKKVLELSLREALELGHNYIGTEHILLGLMREGEGVGAQVLDQLGAELSDVRRVVIELLSGHAVRAAAPFMPHDELHLHVSQPAVFNRAVRVRGTPRTCSFCNRDLWEVDHYVAGPGADICDGCIETAHASLAAAPEDPQRLALPPRVFGTAPADDPLAIEKITRALNAVFGGTLSAAAVAYLEDGAQLVPILLAARERFGVRVAELILGRVRFNTAANALVGYQIVLDNGQELSFTGSVVRVDETWLVTRKTVADVLATGGVQLPPVEEA